MCGIFGVILNGQKKNATQVVLSGLQRLEYRGYDSWGIAGLNEEKNIVCQKQIGQIGQIDHLDLEMSQKSRVSLGHTRWATHGGVTQVNAHPHLSSDGNLALVHNGVVENFDLLKKHVLEAGFQLKTETDSEIIVCLIELELRAGVEIEVALTNVLKKIEGRNAVAIMTNDGQILAGKFGSPLVVGLASEGDVFLSSDTLSFADRASQMIVVGDGQIVILGSEPQPLLINIETGQKITPQVESIKFDQSQIDKQGHPYFMLKEIMESGTVVRGVAESQNQPAIKKLAQKIKSARRVFTIGSGTAGVAAAQAAFNLRKYAQIQAESVVGGDAEGVLAIIEKDDLIIAFSQSGETADVLEVLEECQRRGVVIAAYVNMQGSTMTRMANFSFLAGVGAEICVMSTKVLVAQIAWGYRLAMAVAGRSDAATAQLIAAGSEIDKWLLDRSARTKISGLAEQLKDQAHIFILAKGELWQMAREGMVKLVEGSYRHAHAIPAGDLKHYAITLIEKGTPVIFLSDSQNQSDISTAVHEVKARGAQVIGISGQNDQTFDEWIKISTGAGLTPLSAVIALQLLAYELSVALGHDPDHPRNIAKSVTVK